MKTIYVILTTFIIGSAFGQAPPQPTWRMTLKVVDGDGNPVAGAKAAVSFFTDSQPAAVGGLTDTNGILFAEHSVGPSYGGYELGFAANKTGYYSVKQVQLLPPTYDPAKWNQTIKLKLFKIRQPTAMYAKWISSEPQVFKKTGRPQISFTNTVGFDFGVGDWVAPFGHGANADIFLTEEFNKKSLTDYYFRLTASFPHKGDGIQEFAVPQAGNGSQLRSPYQAPADGYQHQFVETQRTDPNRNFFFRVRTLVDENGNIKSALYGKIYGDFMHFCYYLNPTPNDRNVEFDPGQNLLHSSHSDADVNSP